MRRVRWSIEAIEQVDAVFAYVAADSKRNAEGLLERIDESARLLGEFATGRPSYAPGVYEKPVRDSPYILVCQLDVTPLGEAVTILRVVHGARNWRPSAPRT